MLDCETICVDSWVHVGIHIQKNQMKLFNKSIVFFFFRLQGSILFVAEVVFRFKVGMCGHEKRLRDQRLILIYGLGLRNSGLVKSCG